MELIAELCSRPLEGSHLFNKYEATRWPFERTEMLKRDGGQNLLDEQMCNLGELLVKHVLLDQNLVDSQWSCSNSSEGDESNEGEVESMKMYIERYI